MFTELPSTKEDDSTGDLDTTSEIYAQPTSGIVNVSSSMYAHPVSILIHYYDYSNQLLILT